MHEEFVCTSLCTILCEIGDEGVVCMYLIRHWVSVFSETSLI